MTELDPNRTPGTVIAAVAAGTVVVPFLVVYAFLFIARGAFVQVDQPDITSSRTGETVAGVIALAFLVVVFAGMGRLLNGRGRWLFIAGQAVAAGVSIWFLLDSTSGDPEVPALVLVASLLAIALTLTPVPREWVAGNGGNEQLHPAGLEADRDAVPRPREQG